MFYGKVIAGAIGFMVAGIFGLLLGVFIGHSFDRGLSRTFSFASPENIARIQQSFFETTFKLLGHLAKADGHISRQEIDHAEMIITQMGLSSDQRRRAIDYFRSGASPEFNLHEALSSFNEVCGAQKHLQQTLLMFLISMALADAAGLDAKEHAALRTIAQGMGFSPGQLEQLLSMASAQDQFRSGSGAQMTPESALENAYASLGVAPSATDKELKRAYRKLMSENHPDKLIAKGVPEEMIKIATEKSQEILSAYELIRKHRGATSART